MALEEILHYFNEITLPVIVSEDYLEEYQSDAPPLPIKFVEEYIKLWEGDYDEFTEFVPCFSLPPEKEFTAIVYWKGGLLKYDFILATFKKDGSLINKKTIAGTIVEGSIIKKSIASIEEDWIINIIAGHTYDGEEYDAEMSKAYSMEVLPNGEIIFSLD